MRGFLLSINANAVQGLAHSPHVKGVYQDVELPGDEFLANDAPYCYSEVPRGDDCDPAGNWIYNDRTFQGFPQTITCTDPDPFASDCIDNWGLDRLDGFSVRRDGKYDSPGDGTGVHVYVLDTGIKATNLEFGNRVSGGHNGTYDEAPECATCSPFCFPPCGTDTNDYHGHGTHVAAIIGGQFAGVALEAEAEPIGYTMNGLELTRLDLGTGLFSTVGPVGVNQVAGATFDLDGFIYALSELSDELWRVEPSAGASSLIGAVGVDVGAESGLAFDACGVLWMVTNRRLYTLDPNSGTATFVHDLGRPVFGLTAYGDELFGLVNMRALRLPARIKPETGEVAPFGDTVFLPTQREGLDFDADGRLWGLYWIDSPLPEPWVSSIVEYEPASGAILSIREIPEAELAVVIGGNLAIAPPRGLCRSSSVLTIPQLSVAGLVVLAAFLAGAAVVFLRRVVAGRPT